MPPHSSTRQQPTDQTTPSEKLMDNPTLSSTSIATAAYDPSTCTLDIRFHTGRHYRYFAVPAQIYQELLAADSKGRYFNQHIRAASFPYHRIR